MNSFHPFVKLFGGPKIFDVEIEIFLQ